MSYFLQTGDCVGVKFMLSFHTCRIHKRSRTRGQEQKTQYSMCRPVHPTSSECDVLECSIIWAAPDHGILFRHSSSSLFLNTIRLTFNVSMGSTQKKSPRMKVFCNEFTCKTNWQFFPWNNSRGRYRKLSNNQEKLSGNSGRGLNMLNLS